MKTIKILNFILILASLAFAINENQKPYQFWIMVKDTNSILIIKAKGSNNSALSQTFQYQLTAEKNGPSGTSRSKQGGKFTLHQNEEKVLSELKINLQEKDNISIKLKIYKETQLIDEISFSTSK